MKLSDEYVKNARNVDIISYLSEEGHSPEYYSKGHAWYCSPIRGEDTPSFQVRTNINKWIDYGGSDIHLHDVIDLVMIMRNVDFRQAVEILNNGNFSPSRPTLSTDAAQQERTKYENIRELPIATRNLIRYLYGRGITYPTKIEVGPLCELRFNKPGEHEQWHVAWRNDAGGYVVRRATDEPGAKCKKFNIGKTDITTIRHNSQTCYIFEGFFDYLSFIEMNEYKAATTDAIILNSVSNKQRAVDALQTLTHTKVCLLLDKDKSGNEGTAYFVKQLHNEEVKDIRQCIRHGKDVNDELVWRLRHPPI